MRSRSSLSRSGVLLITLISPILLGSYFRCVAVSNPTVATARIDTLEPSSPRVGEVVRVSGSGNGSPPLQFAWDFGDGVLVGGMQATHVYTAAGSYRVTLTVRDALGNVAAAATQVAVSPRMLPSMLSLVLASKAVAAQPVVFAASPLAEEGGALSYAWTFSDGQSALGPVAVVTFPAPGAYHALVTVKSDSGATGAGQMVFEVAAR